MRQETYQFALDEAAAELRDILTQFEALKARKEQIEKAIEALQPYLNLQIETAPAEASAAFTLPAEESSPEPVEYTYMQISGPGMEIAKIEPAPAAVEQVPEPVAAATQDQAAYFRQPSADPFQRRIDDALWGWQQRPEGLLSPI
jgi:hypothetical protein